MHTIYVATIHTAVQGYQTYTEGDTTELFRQIAQAETVQFPKQDAIKMRPLIGDLMQPTSIVDATTIQLRPGEACIRRIRTNCYEIFTAQAIDA